MRVAAKGRLALASRLRLHTRVIMPRSTNCVQGHRDGVSAVHFNRLGHTGVAALCAGWDINEFPGQVTGYADTGEALGVTLSCNQVAGKIRDIGVSDGKGSTARRLNAKCEVVGLHQLWQLDGADVRLRGPSRRRSKA